MVASSMLWLAVLAPVVLVRAQDCESGTIEAPNKPDFLEEYHTDMANFGTAEMSADEKNAREARAATQKYFTRTATKMDSTVISVSDRFCALEYEAEGAECPAVWENGNAKPKGLECAGVPTAVDSECDDANMALYIGLPAIDDTTGALTVAMGVPIVLGVVFMVLWALFYFGRCCKLCGGRKASVGCCCPTYFDKDKYDMGVMAGDDGQGEMPTYLAGTGCQVFLFRVWFAFFFVLVAVAAAIGGMANTTVDTGLANTVDILFYDVQKLAYETSTMLEEMNAIMSAAGLALGDEAMADQQGALNCLSQEVTAKELEIADAKDLGLDARSYFVYATLGIPLLIGIIYIVSALFKLKCFVCFGSFLAWVLLIIVCISAAIHSLLSLLMADICYEFDLHLATYHLESSDFHGTRENLAWLPPEATGFCGEDGELAFIETEFENQFDTAIQEGMTEIANVCNDPEMQGFMDCSGVSILTSAGTPPVYSAKTVDHTDDTCNDGSADPVPCGASYYNALLADVPDELMITDVDLTQASATDLASIPNEVKNCLAPAIAAVGGVWASTGWDITVNNVEACTENGVAVEGYCLFLASASGLTDDIPTAATTAGACGVCSDTNLLTQADCVSPATWVTTGHTWTPLTYTAYTAADGPLADIEANAALCITAASYVFAGRTGAAPDATTDAAAIAAFYTFPYAAAEWSALEGWEDTPPTAEAVKQCYIQINTASPCTVGPCVNPYFPQKSFRACADTCAEAEAKQQAETAVGAIDTATALFVDLKAVFDEQAKPKLQCKFVSDIVYDIFYPLCQEAYGGIFLITLANYIALVGLIISLPLGIMATKRFVPTSSGETEDNMVGAKHQM